MTEPTEIIRIVFTTEDVRSMAKDANVPEDVALERAMEWGKHIENTARQLCSEQLASAIAYDTP